VPCERAPDVFFMSEQQRPDRQDATGQIPDRDRDSRVEELLLTGLDHYFAGRHDLAINVWTRVLFLDRGHGRARAYIERARGAIAERQREGDELIHTGTAALERGDIDSARRLLSSAVERGVSSEEAIALLERLERLLPRATEADGAQAPSISRRVFRRGLRPPRASGSRSRMVWIATGVLGGLLAAAAAGVVLWIRGDAWLSWTPAPSAAPSAVPNEPLPVPSASEVWMTRGRNLYSRGRLHEALAALEAIRPGDPLRGQADTCRAAIQRHLLAAARSDGPPPAADALRAACGEPTR
jgi:tetratricopeptide (TPR) repeat protein